MCGVCGLTGLPHDGAWLACGRSPLPVGGVGEPFSDAEHVISADASKPPLANVQALAGKFCQEVPGGEPVVFGMIE